MDAEESLEKRRSEQFHVWVEAWREAWRAVFSKEHSVNLSFRLPKDHCSAFQAEVAAYKVAEIILLRGAAWQ